MQEDVLNMQEDVAPSRAARFLYELLPWLFLLFTLVATYFIWQSARVAEFKEKETAFHAQLSETASQFTQQMTVYQQALYGVRSFFDASEFVTKHEFDLFVHDMLNTKLSAGLHQVGFAKFVDPLDPNTYRHLNPKLKHTLLQLDQQSLHAPVIYLATQDKPLNQALIPDAFAEKQVKKAMEAAAQQDEILVTKVIGAHDDERADSFSMVLPVYTENHYLAQNSASKKTSGWIFFNLDMPATYVSVFMQKELPEISYRLHQQAVTGESPMLFQSVADHHHESVFSSHRNITLLGQDWTLYADSLIPFEEKLDYSHSDRIGLLGLLVTAALMSTLFLLVSRLKTFDRLKQVNHRLKLSDERWLFALEGSGDGVWDWDIVNNKIEYSKRWRQLFGYKPEELTGTEEEREGRLHPDDRHLMMRALNTYLRAESDSYSSEYRLKCRNGDWKWVLARGMVVARSDEGEALRMVGTHTDISQLKESEAQIWQHANFDYLTNLPNRRMLYAKLEREIAKVKRSGAKLALLFLDLDGFKEINDSLGHDQGDVLLRQAAERLTESTFTSDIVARLGGDEFIILVTDITDEKLKKTELIAQKILSALAVPFLLNDEQAFVTASMGIVVYPDDSSTIDDLIKSVDQAMYASKNRGGNCFTYFTPQMQENALSRLRLSNDLRLALDKKELFIEYQPIVDLATGDIYKAEALLRWQHGEKGFISPAEFIPIAEDTRLINEIGSWVFMESIKQCEIWREALDQRFQIAVNKSAVQFLNVDPLYHHWLDTLLVDTAKSNTIVVEITESILLEASEHVANRLREYRKKGVQIALDDFGTGYSSLSYLRKFDFDYLKIDQSFVANLEESEEDRELCKAIIVMAHSLGIKVVAEGIETLTQRDFLIEVGCDYGQGWYYAKSLLPADFEEYVKK